MGRLLIISKSVDLTWLTNAPSLRSCETDEIKRRLNYPDAVVSLERIESTFGPLAFGRNQTTLSATATATIDRAGQILQQHPTWRIEIAPDAEGNERTGTADERAKSISNYLNSK